MFKVLSSTDPLLLACSPGSAQDASVYTVFCDEFDSPLDPSVGAGPYAFVETALAQSPDSVGLEACHVPPGFYPQGQCVANAIGNIYAYANGLQFLHGVEATMPPPSSFWAATPAQNVYASAFQLALWELIYDYSCDLDCNCAASSLNLSAGNFAVFDPMCLHTTTSNQCHNASAWPLVQAQAQLFFAAASVTRGIEMVALSNPSMQDIVLNLTLCQDKASPTASRSGAPTATPAAAAATLTSSASARRPSAMMH